MLWPVKRQRKGIPRDGAGDPSQSLGCRADEAATQLAHPSRTKSAGTDPNETHFPEMNSMAGTKFVSKDDC